LKYPVNPDQQDIIIPVSDSGVGIERNHKKSIFNSETNSISVGLLNEKGSCFCFTVPSA